MSDSKRNPDVTRIGVRRQRQVVNIMTLEAAYDAWSRDLVRYASALVEPQQASDVVADTFVDLLASDGRGWSRAKNPRSYLFGAVANHARMRHRTSARREQRARHPLAVTGSAPAATESLPDVRDDVSSGLDGLSVQQRAIVFLTYWEDLPPAEVAGVLGISEGSVRKQLARARARLREALR